MKKIIFSLSALAALLLAGSCQRENLEPVEQGGTVTYTVQVPEAIATKAIGDGFDGVTKLIYEVYREKDLANLDADPIYEGIEELDANGQATFSLEFVKDQNFRVLFWAQDPDATSYDTDDLREVTLNTSLSANDVDEAVFAGSDEVVSCASKSQGNVTLSRPVAQLNIYTHTDGLTLGRTSVDLETSWVKVKGLSTTYNVATKAVGNTDSDFTYAETDVPTDTAPIADYKYVATNYVGFAPEAGKNVDVEFYVVTSEGKINHSVSNVPLKANYRTNIVGNLITATDNYQVTIEQNWADAGKDMEVLADGLVKNINGDYEVSNAKGLAYAINNLWANGGNFYLTAAEYDMTGLNVTPATIAADKTLNIYGETPVVTRAMTSIAGITIKGLDSIIKTISADANVSISGVELVDEGSVLVETNSGNLVVSESTGEKAVINTGKEPVKANNIDSLAALKAALATGVKNIDITGNIVNEDKDYVLLINNSVTINGTEGTTITSNANRVFRIIKSEIEVVINNLDIVSPAVMVWPSDVRGVSIDGSLSNVILTLNDCSIDFTDVTTNDWTYAVNVSGNGTGHNVTVNGGSYEGANVINAHGANNIITVKNATLNSLYPSNDVYYGACIWVLQNQGSSVYAEGNTFNGNNAIAFNLGTGTALEEKDNVDNTKMVVAKVGEAYYTSLPEAFAAAESGATVKVLHNTEMTPKTPVTVASGKTITLDLNGKTVSNITSGTTNPQDAILVKGNLTVKNGTITTEHKGENLGWSAQSSIFNITGGGIVNLKDVVAKNLGGTDMGFVAHLNNWGEATFTAENCTLEANYVAVRVFNSGYDKNNVTIKNSTLKGGNYAFWVHNYTVADFGTAEKAIAQQKLLNFNLTEGNTFVGKNDTPIRLGMTGSMYLAADQIGNLPTYASVDSEETLIAALQNASTVNSIIYFANDITISNKWDNRYTGAKTSKPIEINGNGKTLKFTGLVEDKNYMSVFRFENVATVKNLTIDLSEATNTGQMRAISSKSTLSVENCTFLGKSSTQNTRAIIFGEGANPNFNFGVSIKNSTFTNWKRGITDNENGQDIKEVVIEGNTCTNAHVYVSAYESITFNNNILNNSCVNIRSYKSSETVRITAKGNTLDSNLSDYNVIGHSSSKCDINNIDAQEGFIVYAE